MSVAPRLSIALRVAYATSAVAVLLATASGCGGGGGASAPTPARAADFPAVGGKTLTQLVRGLPKGPIFASSVSLLDAGSNRVGFALFDPSHKQITNAAVALYTSDLDGTHVAGPYPARYESLAVKPQYQSETVAKDPGAAQSLYVATVPFARRGKQGVIGVARVGGRLEATTATEVDVGAGAGSHGPPAVGASAISVHTPTTAQVGRNLGQIDTRLPPAPDLHRVDFASVLGRKPVILLFATPALCQSRVCGPVVDIEEQARAQVGDKIAFIHMEIYKDNNPGAGFRPQVGAWRLPTEPWLFVIDRRGRVVQRIEGAFSADELRGAVQRVIGR